MVEYTLGKKERLNSKTLIERLFLGGSKSFHSDQRAQEAVQTCGKA